MTMTKRDKIIERQRQLQPIEELERKAYKAATRANLWTQEEIDLAMARGEFWARWLIPGHSDGELSDKEG